MHIQFDIQLQCIQISTRINSSMYIRTSSFVSFEMYPIFNSCFVLSVFTVSFRVNLFIDLGFWDRVVGSLWHFYDKYTYFKKQ